MPIGFRARRTPRHLLVNHSFPTVVGFRKTIWIFRKPTAILETNMGFLASLLRIFCYQLAIRIRMHRINLAWNGDPNLNICQNLQESTLHQIVLQEKVRGKIILFALISTHRYGRRTLKLKCSGFGVCNYYWITEWIKPKYLVSQV